MRDSEAALFRNRIEFLEEELASCNRRLHALEVETFGVLNVAPRTTPKRMGRTPKLEVKELLERRSKLCAWIENVWPYLLWALPKAHDARAAAEVMCEAKKLRGYVFMPPYYDDPARFADEFWSYWRDKRNHNSPRALAGALAGLPELSWRRSFNVCTEHRMQGAPADAALWDHMRRRFPKRLTELMRVDARNVGEIRAILLRSRTHDEGYLRLLNDAEHARAILDYGKPRQDITQPPAWINMDDAGPAWP